MKGWSTSPWVKNQADRRQSDVIGNPPNRLLLNCVGAKHSLTGKV